MRILYLLPALQHPAVPGSLRHHHFLRALARRHRVTLLALARGERMPEVEREVAGCVERLVTVPVEEPPPGPRTLARRAMRRLAVRRALRRMRREFRALARDGSFDVVLFHGKELYPVVAGFRDLPLVVDFCDATALRDRGRLRHARGTERVISAWRYLRTRRADRALVRLTPFLSFISPRDRAAAYGGTEEGGVVIPNGVDGEYWRRRSAGREPASLVFTGVMSYPPNEDAALFLLRDLLPRLRAAGPRLRVTVVGRAPTPALLQAAHGLEGVEVTGEVDDVRPFLERATLFVAPLRFGAGTQNKVLEALAMELPVVATPLVAGGLRTDDGDAPLRVAEGSDGLAAAVLALLADADERRRLAAEGRRYVETRFDWERSAAMLEALCADAAGASAADPVPAARSAPAAGADPLAAR